jgi:hypothetical protein
MLILNIAACGVDLVLTITTVKDQLNATIFYFVEVIFSLVSLLFSFLSLCYHWNVSELEEEKNRIKKTCDA